MSVRATFGLPPEAHMYAQRHTRSEARRCSSRISSAMFVAITRELGKGCIFGVERWKTPCRLI
jgi:hypothetical protein